MFLAKPISKNDNLKKHNHFAKMSSQSHTTQATNQPTTTPVAETVLPQVSEENTVEQKSSLLAIQPKLTIGSPDDPYENEADSVANHVMRVPMNNYSPAITPPSIQMKCAACEQEEEHVQRMPFSGTIPNIQLCAACDHEEDNHVQRKPFAASLPDLQMKSVAYKYEGEQVRRRPFHITPFVQKKGEDGGGIASDSVSSQIESSRGGGSPMDDSTRSFMEERFGMDFSGVRIHNDSNASQLSQNLNAQAFTVGSDIYFNQGKYSPDSDSGKHLLAHELTHTVQQRKGAIRPKIQRHAYWVGFDSTGKEMTGTHIHSKVLRQFGAKNSDLFTEAPVPNATLKSADYGKEGGSADLYVASSTVGVRFISHKNPAFNSNSKGVRKGDKKYDHNSLARPKMSGEYGIDLTNAPSSIKVGDLKPYGAPISDPDYQDQISHYLSGFRMTKDGINEMAADPTKRHYLSPVGRRWNPHITEMGYSDAHIPDDYKIGSANAPSHIIALKDGFGKKHFVGQRIIGRMYIAYRKDQAGIWNYIWVPQAGQNITAATLPVNIVAMQVNINHVVDPLSDVNIQPKRQEGKPAPKIIQRKKDESGFDHDKWKVDHEKLQNDYRGVAESDKEEAEGKVKSHEVGKEMFSHFGSIPGLETGVDSPKETQNVKLVKRLKFWSNRLSGVVGWLREKFGGTFVKIHKAVQKIKKKVKDIVAKTKSTISKGGIVGAVIKVFIKAFKMLGVYLVNRTVDLILHAITAGFTKKIQNFIESLIPDEVEEEVAKLKKIQDDYEKKALETVDELLERFVGKNLKDFEDFAEVMKVAETANTIISLVRWGARLLACASPPAIGCLWIIAEAVLEEIAAKVVESCWFIKKVIPKIAVFDVVASIPNKIANFVIEQANELMPDGWQDTFEKVPASALGYDGNYQPDCEDGGSGDPLGEQRQEVMELIEAIGEERFVALMELCSKRGAGPWVLLDSERVNVLKNSALKDLDPQTMHEIANDKSKELPVSLLDFVESIKKYSKKEVDTKNKYFDEKTKAEERKAASGSGLKGKDSGKTADPGARVIYDKPKLAGTKTTLFFRVAADAAEYEAAKQDKTKTFNGYIVVVFFDSAGQKQSAKLNSIALRYVSETPTVLTFANVKEFYFFYDDINKKGFYFKAGEIIRVDPEYFFQV